MLLGIDIGGTQIKGATVDEAGAVTQSLRVDTPASLDEFRQALPRLIRQLSASAAAVTAVGIGCKGIINPENTRVEVLPGTLHYLEGQLLSEIVAPALPAGVPIAADNDARVALAGEVAWGAARKCRNVVMLTLGTGVGGGVVADGRVLRGATGAAGHIGHLTVDPFGVLHLRKSRMPRDRLLRADH
jgi:glucokinase